MLFGPRADDVGGDSSAFNRCLTRRFNERLGQFIAYKAAERSLTRAERLAAALSTLFDPPLLPNVSPSLKISQQELAYLVGTSRQRIDEALPLLRDVGAIRAEYGTITLLDLQRLRLYRAPTQTGDASARRTLRSQFSWG